MDMLAQSKHVRRHLYVPCTREERFGHVSNHSIAECDIPKEKEKIKVTTAAQFRQGPSSSSFYDRSSISAGHLLIILLLCFQLSLLETFSIRASYGSTNCNIVVYSDGECTRVCRCDGHLERHSTHEAAFFKSGEE
jgi:hypothetical protein